MTKEEIALHKLIEKGIAFSKLSFPEKINYINSQPLTVDTIIISLENYLCILSDHAFFFVNWDIF